MERAAHCLSHGPSRDSPAPPFTQPLWRWQCLYQRTYATHHSSCARAFGGGEQAVAEQVHQCEAQQLVWGDCAACCCFGWVLLFLCMSWGKKGRKVAKERNIIEIQLKWRNHRKKKGKNVRLWIIITLIIIIINYQACNMDMMKLLLSAGADPFQLDINGRSVFHCVARVGERQKKS